MESQVYTSGLAVELGFNDPTWLLTLVKLICSLQSCQLEGSHVNGVSMNKMKNRCEAMLCGMQAKETARDMFELKICRLMAHIG